MRTFLSHLSSQGFSLRWEMTEKSPLAIKNIVNHLLLHAGGRIYEHLFTQEYHIPWGQCPNGIWYSWVNKSSFFLHPHAINVLFYRMKPRKHIHVQFCWQTYFKSIGTLSQIFKSHIHNGCGDCNGRLQLMRSECLRRFPVKER